LEEQGDPCFGKIVRGQQDAELLFKLPIYEDGSAWHHFILEPVEITQVKVVTKRPDGAEQIDAKGTVVKEAAHDPVHITTDKKEKRRPKLPHIDHAVLP
jgi:hypothetical protein